MVMYHSKRKVTDTYQYLLSMKSSCVCVSVNAPVVVPSVISELLQHCFSPHRPKCLSAWPPPGRAASGSCGNRSGAAWGEVVTGVCNNRFYYECGQEINKAAVFLKPS